MAAGALNESYSDIWGETVDLINGAGTDFPDAVRTVGECSTHTLHGRMSASTARPIATSCNAGLPRSARR